MTFKSYLQPRIDPDAKRRLVLAEVYGLLMKCTIEMEEHALSHVATPILKEIEILAVVLSDSEDEVDPNFDQELAKENNSVP